MPRSTRTSQRDDDEGLYPGASKLRECSRASKKKKKKKEKKRGGQEQVRKGKCILEVGGQGYSRFSRVFHPYERQTPLADFTLGFFSFFFFSLELL